jgi:signal recognition particle subunit SRP19
MRGKGKIVVWPSYFDADLSWGEGRRVAKDLAVMQPKAEDILAAAEEAGLKPVLESGASHPSRPWIVTDLILVEAGKSKPEILKEIASKMRIKRV